MATIRVLTVHLEPDLRERLDRLAKAQRRSRSYVATEAIREYVKVNECAHFLADLLGSAGGRARSGGALPERKGEE
jgi:predicted DNA-binding protein